MGGKATQGSGVPELKTIISGVNDYTYLKLRYLVGKMIALPLALAASKPHIPLPPFPGFQIGKEGCYVHMSNILAHNMMRLPCFRELNNVIPVLLW